MTKRRGGSGGGNDRHHFKGFQSFLFYFFKLLDGRSRISKSIRRSIDHHLKKSQFDHDRRRAEHLTFPISGPLVGPSVDKLE